MTWSRMMSQLQCPPLRNRQVLGNSSTIVAEVRTALISMKTIALILHYLQYSFSLHTPRCHSLSASPQRKVRMTLESRNLSSVILRLLLQDKETLPMVKLLPQHHLFLPAYQIGRVALIIHRKHLILHLAGERHLPMTFQNAQPLPLVGTKRCLLINLLGGSRPHKLRLSPHQWSQGNLSWRLHRRVTIVRVSLLRFYPSANPHLCPKRFTAIFPHHAGPPPLS